MSVQIDEDDAPKDEDYIPGREGGKRSKRKGKGSPKPSPKKTKPLRQAPPALAFFIESADDQQ